MTTPPGSWGSEGTSNSWVPGLPWLERAKALADADAAFARHASWLQANLLLEIGDARFSLDISHGRIEAVREGARLDGWRFCLRGERAAWDALVGSAVELGEATTSVGAGITVDGDRVLAASYWAAVNRLLELLAIAGGAPATSPPTAAPATAGSATHAAVVGRYVDVGGVVTYYETAADESAGPVLLCLHTAGRDNRQYHDFISHYGSRYRVLAPDLPGHQKSWPVAGVGCLEGAAALTDFLWRFLDALDVRDPVVLLGCSLGGNLVFSMAQARPQQVAALVSLEGAHRVGYAVAPFDLLSHPTVRVPDWYDQRIDGLIGRDTPPDRRAFLRWTGRQLTAEAQLADLAAYGEFDVSAGMDTITCPCLLIRGTDDWIVTEEMVRSAAEALVSAASVEVRHIPGAGHFAHYEQPERCFALIDPFLSGAGLPS
jgi:pimeloyl-ACP methyl ester carboxylesterase